MAKAFAMRLMHLGLPVHVIGETTTPSVASGDVVVGVSGSGTTGGTVRVAEQAVKVGATVHAVTTDPDSPLARHAEVVLTVPAATKYRRAGEAATIQPLSSLFDQATHVVLDVVCLELAGRRGVDNAAARTAHANTEWPPPDGRAPEGRVRTPRGTGAAAGCSRRRTPSSRPSPRRRSSG